MLADAGNDYGVSVVLDDGVQLGQHLLGQQGVAAGDVQGRMLGGEAGDGGHPFRAFPPLGKRDQGLQDGFGVAYQRDFRRNDASDLGRLNVQMDDAGVGRKPGDAPGNPVVKAHSQPDKDIGLVNHHIAPVHPVHPQHPQALGMIARETAQPQQGVDDGDAGALGQFAQFVKGAGVDDAMPGDDDGTLGVVNQAGGAAHILQSFGVKRRLRAGRSGRRSALRVLKFGQLQLHVTRDINQHGAGASFLGDAESFADSTRQVVGGQHQVSALGADGGDAANVAFLEGFGAQGGPRYLSGDSNQRHAVGFGAHNAGNQVGGAGAGGCHADAGLAGDAGVAVGGVGGGLLMPHQNMTQLRIGPEGIVKGEDGAAGMAEQHIHALAQQAFADDFGTFQFYHGRTPYVSVVQSPAGQGADAAQRAGIKKPAPISV